MSVFALLGDRNPFVRAGTLLVSYDTPRVSIDLDVPVGLGILHLYNILCQVYTPSPLVAEYIGTR